MATVVLEENQQYGVIYKTGNKNPSDAFEKDWSERTKKILEKLPSKSAAFYNERNDKEALHEALGHPFGNGCSKIYESNQESENTKGSSDISSLLSQGTFHKRKSITPEVNQDNEPGNIEQSIVKKGFK